MVSLPFCQEGCIRIRCLHPSGVTPCNLLILGWGLSYVVRAVIVATVWNNQQLNIKNTFPRTSVGFIRVRVTYVTTDCCISHMHL